jgi:phosphoribosyl-AMP cyclohydrolase
VSDLDPGSTWLDALKWDEQGMIPAIAQDAGSGRVLMFAFMNRQSLQETVDSGSAVYWSRSRQRLWRKGEESGHAQRVRSIRADCDGDVLLLSIDQVGGIACHTGRESCFFYQLQGNAGSRSTRCSRIPRKSTANEHGHAAPDLGNPA